ncbi:SYP124 protein [Hibiscus syriacus]|uniref:SYP124 protein n=1 Tax=Hibiscus syriacus TaxID=106335 RepID=A0A6A2WTQ2_HIBSY|nr:SYP124 protein [Hibiscus syriacus]
MSSTANTMDGNLGLFLEEAEKVKQEMANKARTIKSQLEEMERVPMRPISASRGENPDEETIEKIISDGRGGEGLLTRAVQEHGQGKVMETVVEIQDRHTAAMEIEKSLLELHQVFLDMAVMVEAQGEQMDDIERHVMNASHYVKDGAKELNSAKQYQRTR